MGATAVTTVAANRVPSHQPRKARLVGSFADFGCELMYARNYASALQRSDDVELDLSVVHA